MGECRRAGAGAGGPFWGWGRSGRVRPAGATRNHPHRCLSHATATTATPCTTASLLSRSPHGHRAPGSKEPPLHPPSMAATEPTHALPWGLPAPQPGENRLYPLASELYRRDTAAVSGDLGRAYPGVWA